MNDPDSVTEPDEEAQRRMWRKVGFRILPLIGVAYIISYIDRANLGYVAAPMSADLGMTTAQVGLAAGLFFIGYILVEIPSNMMLHRIGARLWISRILITWGIITGLTGTVHSAGHLYIARVLLGLAEAGLAAGIVLYITLWFPERQRRWAMSLYLLTIPLSGIIGSPIAAALLSWGPRVLHISGWRSLFVVEGALTIAIGFVVLWLLPSRPAKAKWLTEPEKRFVTAALEREAATNVAHGAKSHARSTLLDKRVWVQSFVFFTIVFGVYPLAFFLPTMIDTLNRTIGADGNVSSVLLAAIPSVAAMVAMVIWARVGARRTVAWATAIPMIGGVLGLVVAALTQNGLLFVVAVCVSVSGIYTAIPQFWRLPALTMTGAGAAAGIALINSVANISGFVGPYMTGSIQTATGSFTLALLVVAAIVALGVVVMLTAGRGAERAARRELIEGDSAAAVQTAQLNRNT
ncbi:MFS transporter [Pseudonocardia kujensis]|uniref:MFS transporter n=1 Tax=Pseudonocardia kujensis TaxID=1128675 RepID=UPI001E518571|nr:MFS transporter [Pseudonocardia kujensis]MCE0765054.1 MFS transporter [Pseudonocardia kujensis]